MSFKFKYFSQMCISVVEIHRKTGDVKYLTIPKQNTRAR